MSAVGTDGTVATSMPGMLNQQTTSSIRVMGNVLPANLERK